MGALLPGAAVCIGAAGYGSGALGQAVKALFRLREFDFEALLPRVCPAERILRGDPAYRLSDADTRARVRRFVSRRAEEHNENETALADRLVLTLHAQEPSAGVLAFGDDRDDLFLTGREMGRPVRLSGKMGNPDADDILPRRGEFHLQQRSVQRFPAVAHRP